MQKLTRTLFIALPLALCAATACSDRESVPEADSLHFDFSVVADTKIITKGQTTVSDEIIHDVELLIFDVETGFLVQRLDFEAGSDYSSDAVSKGRRYIVYALANCKTESDPDSLSQVEELTISLGTLAEINAAGLPMAGISEEFTFDDNTSSVKIPVRRLMSKVLLTIDTSSMKGTLTVSGVTLHNTPKTIAPFGGDNKASAENVWDGDTASQDDIARLNAGKSILLMVGENMQGTLLEENDDPWKKTPENIPEKQDCCTYITVEGDYSNAGLTISDLRYNMYLGEDNTSNFDIRRNCIYNLTLSISDEATVLASSWKVERGITCDDREISFDLGKDTLIQNSSTSRRIICSPTTFDYSFVPGEGFEDAGLKYTSNADGTITVTSGAISGKSATGRLYARSWDRARSGYCDFTIMNWDTLVRVNGGQPLLMWKGDTLKFTAEVYFEEKGTWENATSAATINYSGNSGKIISCPGSEDTLRFVAQKNGTGLITASYLGRSHSVRAVASTTKSIFMEPRDTTVRVGDTVALRGGVVFASGDTLRCPERFDYLIKAYGIFKKKGRSNLIIATETGTESPLCIFKREPAFIDSTSCVITVE